MKTAGLTKNGAYSRTMARTIGTSIERAIRKKEALVTALWLLVGSVALGQGTIQFTRNSYFHFLFGNLPHHHGIGDKSSFPVM